MKIILQKMTCGIETIFCLQQKEKLLVQNCLVRSHLHYSSIFLTGIWLNHLTTLEKQVNWAVKACFHQNKFELAHDL